MIFTAAEREAWRPPRSMTVTEWAEANAVIPGGARPGPYDSSLTPYCREIMDACGDDEHTDITVLKSVQSSGSTVSHMALGAWCDLDPDDTLIVFPSEDTAQKQLTDRVLPMFKASGRLSRLFSSNSHDVKRSQIKLTTCTIGIGWSGSPAALASHPYRRVICDEVDKFPAWRGVEADPISLAKDRTLTFGHRAKVLKISTPTTPEGPVYRSWLESPDRRRWWVTCPHCEALQPFLWTRIGWDRQADTEAQEEPDNAVRREVADQIESGAVGVWWTCVQCGSTVSEAERLPLITGGQWVSEGYEPGNGPVSSRVAFHIWAGMSPLVTWSHIVAEYLRSRAAGAGQWQNFVNNYLGEPFEDTENAIESDVFAAKGRGRQPAVCPTWTSVVIATADTQKSYFWWTVRAWGKGYRSRLLAYGRADSPDELGKLTLDRTWEIEDEPNRRAVTSVLLVDARGSTKVNGEMVARTDLVLRWAAADPQRIWPVMGRGGKRKAGDARVTLTRTSKSALYGVAVRIVDTNYYKDVLAYRINTPNEHESLELWEENESVTAEYAAHMSNEHRVLEGNEWVWRPKDPNGRVDLWDCAVYQCVGADLLEVDAQVELLTEARRKQDAEEPDDEPEMIGGGWWNGTRGGAW